MLDEISGLPAHALLVHFVVILVPLAGLCTVLSAAWPAARRRLGIVTPLLALTALVSVPMTMEAGQWLAARVSGGELLQAHISLAQTMLPWTIVLFIVALGQWIWFRWFFHRVGSNHTGHTSAAARANERTQPETARPKPWARISSAAIVVLALVTAAGSTIQVVRVGEAGTRSVWTGNVNETPENHEHAPGGHDE